MPKIDDSIPVLQEIRDLLREQVSMARARQTFEDRQNSMKNWMTIARMVFNVLITIFVIAAFWYFYHTMYDSGLLGSL